MWVEKLGQSVTIQAILEVNCDSGIVTRNVLQRTWTVVGESDGPLGESHMHALLTQGSHSG